MGQRERACILSALINKTWREGNQSCPLGCRQLCLRRLHGGEFTSGATPAVRPPAPALLLCLHPSFAASAPRGIDLFISLSIQQQPCKKERCRELLCDVTSGTAASRVG